MSLVLTVSLPHVVLLGAGMGILSGLKKIFRWNKINIMIFIPLSYLIGELFVVVFLFFSSLVFSRFLWIPLAILLAACFLGWLFRVVRFKEKYAFAPVDIVPVLVIILICLPSVKISFYDVIDLDDPLLIWFFHGKAFFYDNQIDSSYLAHSEYMWSQPAYPVFVPLLSVFHARFLGYWHEILNKSFLFFHWIAGLILFYFLLKARGVPPFFILLGIACLPMTFHKFAVIGVCDSVWALNFLIGIILCLGSWEGRTDCSTRFPLWLGYSFLGMAAMTKNEGLAGALMFIFLFSILSLATKKQSRAALAISFGFFALLVLPWYAFTAVHRIKLLRPVPVFGFLRFSSHEIAERGRFILTYPFKQRLLIPDVFRFMVGSLALASALLLGNLRRVRKFLDAWLVLAVNGSMLIFYFVIYLGTPQSLEYMLTFSLERVLVVNFMLCLLSLLLLARDHERPVPNPLG